MKYVSLSFHINDVGVEGLSRLTRPHDEHAEHLRDLLKVTGATEAFTMATCNRVEYVFAFHDQVPETFTFLSDLIPRVYVGIAQVTEHLLGVALSKDSVVFGENQIMGQFKDSFSRLAETDVLGSHLNRLLSLVLREAKAARTELGLSNCHTSVATVAAKQLLKRIKNGTNGLLLVGAGETHQILARFLIKRGFKNIIWTNRTDARAQSMAREIGGGALLWSDFLTGDPPKVDAISCATSAGQILITEKMLDRSQPVIVVDLSVPANTKREDARVREIEYFGLDEMNLLMQDERVRYDELIGEMSGLIRESVKAITSEMSIYRSGHVLSESVKRSEDVYSLLMTEGLPQELSALSPDQQEALKAWSQRLVKKLMHTHLETLKVVLKNQES